MSPSFAVIPAGGEEDHVALQTAWNPYSSSPVSGSSRHPDCVTSKRSEPRDWEHRESGSASTSPTRDLST